MSTCDRCKKHIAATGEDPVCITSLGTHHYVCMRVVWVEKVALEAQRKEEIRRERSRRMKKRWKSGAMVKS